MRIQNKRRGFRLLSLIVAAVIPLALQAQTDDQIKEKMTLYVGEVKVIRAPQIERVAVGNGDLLSTSVTDSGQLILLAEDSGDTGLHIWNADGTERDVQVYIEPSNSGRTLEEIRSMVGVVEGLQVLEVAGRPVLKGTIGPKHEDIVEELTELYPDLVNLTNTVSVSNDKMIYMNVKITEFNTRAIEDLGVTWTDGVVGPTAAFGAERTMKDAEISILGASNTPAAISPRTQVDLTAPVGFFGIATEITSLLNFMIEDSNAIVLAEPRLSAKSGGQARFLAGGEIPITTTSELGENVEFKEFGIKLEIRPVVDDYNNVVARVETEVSTVDEGLEVGGIPGFRSRKTETDISLKEGETLVISGLIDQQLSENIDKVKFLGDLPILGRLFRSESFNQSKSELVIFVTPRVIDANSKENVAEKERARKLVEDFKGNLEREVILD